MIQNYIKSKYGFKVHIDYNEEVKCDSGLPMYGTLNAA